MLPTFTTSHRGNEFSPGQLAFAAVASLGLYLLLYSHKLSGIATFLPVAQKGQKGLFEEDESHADPPSARSALISLALLLVALIAVVGLAELQSSAIEHLVTAVGFPSHSLV